jgi:hypothetical protein
MRTAYVNFSQGQMKRDGRWGCLEPMANVQASPTLGYENIQANSPEELQQVIDERGAKIVHFYATYMPQRAMESSVCVEKKLYTRWFNWKPRTVTAKEAPTMTIHDLDLDEIIL